MNKLKFVHCACKVLNVEMCVHLRLSYDYVSTQRPRRCFNAVLNLYGSASGFSKRTNHSCVASTQGYNFWEAHVRPSQWTQGGSPRT